MRVSLLLLSLLALAGVALAAPQGALCPSLPVELQLRATDAHRGRFAITFASVDPSTTARETADFVDIHYRVNNEESINQRVLTQASLSEDNVKMAIIDGIELMPGDVLRAYATYSARGIACDTPVHTFQAPEISELEMATQQMQPRRDLQRPIYSTQQMRMQQQRPIRSIRGVVPSNVTPLDLFYAAAAEQAERVEAHSALCPSIPIEVDVMKVAGLRDSYVLSFENKNPVKQLHYVDLHIQTDPAEGWDNLRLASDMQLTLAHRVMQPGVVVHPDQTLKYYWSYRTVDGVSGQSIDCTTPIETIRPHEVTKEVSMQALQAAALWE